MITRYISKAKLNALKEGYTPCAAVLYTEEDAKPFMKNDPKMQLVKVIIMTDEEKSGINL